jgi:membrane protein implicated in regulation of membrane protease activity
MSLLAWAFILLAAALVLLVVEMFVPSHGVIGGIAGLCVISAVLIGFYQSPVWGVTLLALSALIVPIAIWAVFFYWPHTPLGQKILIKLPSSPDEVLPESYRDTKALVGKIGVAKTKMLLSGAIEIEGRTYDAVSESLPIEPGTEVQVVAIKMNRIVVRGLDPNRPRERPTFESATLETTPPPVVSSPSPAAATPATAPLENASPEDLLARSAASFGLEDLAEFAPPPPSGDAETQKERE